MADRSVTVGTLEVTPPLFLAPMAGLTHSALRAVIAGFGGVGLFSSEMLSARSLPWENARISPFLVTTEAESPLSYQLLAGNVDEIAGAVARLEELGADAVDLNLGCAAPGVRRRGAGLALWNDLERLGRVVSEIRRRTALPFTAKIRLCSGSRRVSCQQEFQDRVKFLEALGVDAIYLHARRDREPFARKPQWKMAGLVRQWLSIPLIVNGGIFSVPDARKCLEESGADGLMIGRAAAVRPWIFMEMASELYNTGSCPGIIDLPRVYMAFASELLERFPADRRLGRLKEFTHYFSRNYTFGNRLAMSVQRSRSVSEAMDKAMRFFEKNRGAERQHPVP